MTILSPRILLAEDDEIMRVTLYDRLTQKGWEVDEAKDGRAALAMVEEGKYHLVLSDIRMPKLDGSRLLEKILQLSPSTDVIMMTAYGSVEDAITCLKKGAADYILKPFDMDDITIRIERLLEMQAIKARCVSLEECYRQAIHPIIGSSPAMQSLLKIISQVAVTDSSVLVSGESGTGKELVAAAIHHGGRRASGPYIRINCGAIPEGLLESELFGHEKGAFTSADSRKTGRVEMADGGTILLDEIGDLPLPLQVKFLRFLQEKEIERVGGSHTIKIDARVICATAKNLLDEVKSGRFREDLFYRLQVIPLEIPPLRERKEDIPELSRYFLDEFSRERGVSFSLSEEGLDILMSYDFPGNVRELRNIIERMTVLAPSPVLHPWNLPLDISDKNIEQHGEGLNLADAVERAEKDCIMKALKKALGKRTKASELLGISRKNLWEKMKHLNIIY